MTTPTGPPTEGDHLYTRTGDPELDALIDQWWVRIHEIVEDGLDYGEQVAILTRVMRVAESVTVHAAQKREDAVYAAYYSPERKESMASIARRAGVTPQALTRVLSIARSKKGDEDREF